jgi:hypothetical protein
MWLLDQSQLEEEKEEIQNWESGRRIVTLDRCDITSETKDANLSQMLA